jgi:UV DNA damage endonuclease
MLYCFLGSPCRLPRFLFFKGIYIMKHRIGYACINLTAGFAMNRTCRLASASDFRLRALISENLDGLLKVLHWNKENNIDFSRISSDIIPFASHEVNKVKWKQDFKAELLEIGKFIKDNDFKVEMHPNQTVNINSPRKEVVKSSIEELKWHVEFFDAMELNSTHKIVFHTGGVYGERNEAMRRFVDVYTKLPDYFKNRLILENDDRSYNAHEVLQIHEETGIPLVFDYLHHKVLNAGTPQDEDVEAVLKRFICTWDEKSGTPTIHYSNQRPNARAGSHDESINIEAFSEFLRLYGHLPFDVMFETKDKDKSVLAFFKTAL